MSPMTKETEAAYRRWQLALDMYGEGSRAECIAWDKYLAALEEQEREDG